MNPYFKTAGLLLASLTTACGAVVVDDSPGPRFSYFDGDFEFATHKGAIVADVAGNPFGINQQQFAKIVRNTMRGHVDVASKADFVESSNEATLAPYRVVVAFNPPPRIDNHDLCEQRVGTPSLTGTGEIKVRMAFCFGDTPKSGSTAWVSDVSSLEDPRFSDLVRKATLAMIPTQDSEETGEGILP